MPDFLPDEPPELTSDQRFLLNDLGVATDYQPPTVNCPHPRGSAEAEAWWRHEWEVATAWAIIRGDLDKPADSDDNVSNLPGFPLHALPPGMRALAESIAANKCVPVDLAAMLLLAAVALVAGPRVVISRGKGWIEPLAEWALVIMEVGHRKSPGFKVIESILLRLQRMLADDHAERTADRIAEIEQEIAGLTRPVEDAKADGKAPAAKAKNASRAQDENAKRVKALAAELELLQEDPGPPPRLLVGGATTPEALERAMSRNSGQIGVFEDEGAAFNAVAGPYQRGVITGVETILKARDASHVAPGERITRETKAIPRAVLTYGITCQSDPLMRSLAKQQLRAIGFHARWFYSVPEPIRSVDIDPPELDYDAVDQFADLLARLIRHPIIDPDIQHDDREWPTLELSPAARKLHQELQLTFAGRHSADGDLAFMEDWANKYVGRVLRHAGLLHLAAGRSIDEAVSEDTMRDAIAIGDYAIAHASEVFRRAPKMARGWNGAEEEIAALSRLRVEKWIRSKQPTHFTAREVHQTVKQQAWCRSREDVDTVLGGMARDWVVRVVPRQDKAGRHLSGQPWWVPNPNLVFGAEAA